MRSARTTWQHLQPSLNTALTSCRSRALLTPLLLRSDQTPFTFLPILAARVWAAGWRKRELLLSSPPSVQHDKQTRTHHELLQLLWIRRRRRRRRRRRVASPVEAAASRSFYKLTKNLQKSLCVRIIIVFLFCSFDRGAQTNGGCVSPPAGGEVVTLEHAFGFLEVSLGLTLQTRPWRLRGTKVQGPAVPPVWRVTRHFTRE